MSDRTYIIPDNQTNPIKSIGLKSKTSYTGPGEPFHGTSTSSVIEMNNIVYVINNHDQNFKVEINDDGKGVLTSTWTAISPMDDGEKMDFALGKLNKKIYVCGGNKMMGRNLDKVQIYNIDENSWSSVASMTTARSGHGNYQVNYRARVQSPNLKSRRVSNKFLDRADTIAYKYGYYNTILSINHCRSCCSWRKPLCHRGRKL